MERAIYNEDTRDKEPSGTNTMRGYDHTRFSNSSEYAEMLRTACRYYDDMRDLRLKCIRDNDYYMGRQLNDTIVYNGHPMTIHDYMEMKGMTPLSNDIITDKVVTLKGLMRNQYKAPKVKSVDVQEADYAKVLSELLRQNDNNNRKSELMAKLFETHLTEGFTAAKASWTIKNGREDVYLKKKNIYDLALPPFSTEDLEEIEFIAEGHDLTWPKLVQKLAKKPGDEEKLRQIYSSIGRSTYIQSRNGTGMNNTDIMDDFLHPRIYGTYRVIEIWRKEYNRALWCHDRLNATAGFFPLSEKKLIDEENRQRKLDNIRRDENGVPLLDADGNQTYYVPESELELIEYEPRIEEMWYYRLLSPNGYLLDEGISPYKMVRDGFSSYYQPYVFLAYGKDGEVRSFEDRIIDKQRQYNHDNVLIDFIIMNSSKGVLAIDEESLSDNMDVMEMMDQYVKVDGYVLYTSKNGGQVPQQIQNKSLPAGLDLIMQRDRELLTTQSNVQPALQGQNPDAGTSYKRYAAQQQSSAVGVADYLASFNDFALRLSKIQLWTIQAFYTSRRSVQITGEDFTRYYDPETMGDMDCDLVMTLDANSAVIREQMQELAYQAYEKDEIAFEQMLDAADFGDTATLKRMVLEHRKEKMALAQAQAAAGQVPTGQAPGVENRDNGATRFNSADETAAPAVPGISGISA